VDVVPLELEDRLVGSLHGAQSREDEAPRTTGFAIGHDGGRFDLAGCREHLSKPFGRGRECETADEKFLRHGAPPSAAFSWFHAVSSYALQRTRTAAGVVA